MPRKNDETLLKRVSAFETKAKALREAESLEARCARIAARYRSVKLVEETSNVLTVNVAFPNVRIQVASIFAKRPDVTVRPRRIQDVRGAKQMELALRHFTVRQKYAREIRRALRHGIQFPYGCVKLGIDKDHGGMPWIENVHPLAMMGDPTQEYFMPEKGRIVFFKFKRSMADLRSSALYDERDLDRLAEHLMRNGTEAWGEETHDLWLWEIYLYESIENKRGILVLVKPVDGDILIRADQFTDVVGLPVRTLIFNEADDTHFPFSTLELWEDQQKELNALRTNQVIASERSNTILGYDLNRIPEDERKKLTSTQPNIRVGTDGPPGEIMRYVDQANLTSDIYQGETRVIEDIQNIEGVGSAALSGRSRTPSPSATEATIVENKLRARASDRQDVFEEWLDDLYQAVGNLAQKHLSADLWMRITNEIFVKITKEDIKGDFDYVLGFGSTLPTDKNLEKAQALELWDRLSAVPEIDRARLLRYLLAQYDVREAQEWILPPPEAAPVEPAGAPLPEAAAAPVTNGQMQPADHTLAANLAAQQAIQEEQTPLQEASAIRALLGG